MLAWLTRWSVAIPLATLAVVAPAHATLYCELATSQDGFAALREAPSRNSKMLMKLTQAHMVLLDDTKQPPASAKAWVGVSAVPSDDPRNILARGWIHNSMIKPDSCG